MTDHNDASSKEISHERLDELERKVETASYHYDLGESDSALTNIRSIHEITGEMIENADTN